LYLLVAMKPARMIIAIKCYDIEAVYDLLGDTVIVCDYGSRAVNNDHRHIVKVDSMDDVRGIVDGIVKVRVSHGYEFV